MFLLIPIGLILFALCLYSAGLRLRPFANAVLLVALSTLAFQLTSPKSDVAADLALVVCFFSILLAGLRFQQLFLRGWDRRFAALFGVLLATATIGFAIIGLDKADREFLSTEFWRQKSVAAYEAAQLLALNMDKHDTEAAAGDSSKPVGGVDRDWAFSWARFCAVILAFYLAYQGIVRLCVGAYSHMACFWHGLPWLMWLGLKRQPTLVLGLGTIGMQLVEELRECGETVIVIEKSRDNEQIREARSRGAIVLIGDASEPSTLDDARFRAAREIFVVAGSDDANMQAALVVIDDYRLNTLRGSSGKRLFRNLLKKLRCCWYHQACHTDVYVRLYDLDLKSALDRAVFQHQMPSRSVSNRCLSVHIFNSDENAARQLVKTELSNADIRPRGQTGREQVAQYIIAGFGPMGQEMLLALAQLAHFENLKRSRILVLCSPDAEPLAGQHASCAAVRQVLARYPRLTVPGVGVASFKDVSFEGRMDDWTYNGPGGATLFKEPNEGLRYATQTRFATLPPCPSDRRFLAQVQSLISGECPHIKPAIIVCFEKEAEAFRWTSVFRDAWRAYCHRDSLEGKVPCLPVYTWIPSRNALRDALLNEYLFDQQGGSENNMVSVGCFGDAASVSSVDAIRAHQRKRLAEAVANSYGQGAPAPTPKHYPVDLVALKHFLDQQSNLNSADHAYIKFAVMDQDTNHLSKLTIPDDPSYPKSREALVLETADGRRTTLWYRHMTESECKRTPMVDLLGKVEHNRWAAEVLLRGYDWTPAEQRIGGLRDPAFFHLRKSLLAWDDPRLRQEDKQKDWSQVHKVMGLLLKLCQQQKI